MKLFKLFCALTLAMLMNISFKGAWARPDVHSPESVLSSSQVTKHESSSHFPWLVPYQVNHRPEILNTLTNRTLSVGNGASFKCRVVGNPKPRIKWKKNGVTIAENKRIKVRVFDWGSRLRIRNIQKSDAGVYRCIAKNPHGNRVSSPAHVKIRDNKKGRCEVYTGSLCNTNLFHLSYGQIQHKIEKTILKTINSLKGKASPKCIKQLTRYLCRQKYPSCTLNRNNKPRKVCREECHELEKRACRRDIPRLGLFWRRIVTCDNLPSVARQPDSNCQQVFGYKPPFKPTSPSIIPQPGYVHHHLSNQCTRYNGQFCKEYVTPGTTVVIHGNQTQTEAEKRLDRLFQRLQGYISTNCGIYLKKALCYHIFSPCSNDPVPKPKHICRLQCEILQGRVCSKEFQLAKLVKQDMINLPRCYTLPPNQYDSKKQCISLGINVNDPANSNLDRCSAFLKRTKNKDNHHSTLKPLSSDYKPCPKEIFESPLTTKLPKAITMLLLNVQSSVLQSQIVQKKRNAKTVYCIPFNTTLKSLTWDWKHYHNTLPLPHVRIQPRSVKIPGIEVTIDRFSSLETVLVPFGSAVSYRAHAKIHLENVTFFYRYHSPDGAFMAKGKYRLCESVFDVVLVTLPNGAMRITGNSSSPLDINTIERVFGLAKTSSSIHDVIRRSELLLMRLINPSIEVFIDNDLTVKFSGQSYLGPEGLPTFLEFHCGKLSNSDVLVTSLSTQGLAFNDALRIFAGLNFPSFDWMRQSSNESKVGVLLSTTGLQADSRLQIKGESLTSSLEGSIPPGLTMVAQTRVPSHCEGNRFCELVKVIFGQGSLFKVKIISNADRVSLDIGFDKASHHALIKYKTVKLSMNVVKGNMTLIDVLPLLSFKANGYIQMSNSSKENLFLNGKLDYDGVLSKLDGFFQVKQDWVNALGIKYLTLSNLHARFSLPTGPSNSQTKHVLNTRGDLHFGAGCSQYAKPPTKSSCITGQVFLGLSEDISQHYFYGKLGPVSLKQLFEAYGYHVQLPQSVESIGFPKGLKISVARSLHDERINGGPLVNPGLLMSGRIRVLGIETDATVSLTPREFLIDADVTGDPIERLKKVDTTKNNKKTRTKLYMKTRMNPSAFVKININGYSRIFGIFDTVDILVSGKTTQIRMVAEIHRSIYAHVYLTSNYSTDRNKTHMEAKIIFKNELSKLTRLASKHIVNMLETEMSEIKMVEKEVKQRSKDCVKSSKKQCSKCIDQSNCFNNLVTCYKTTQLHKKSTLLSACQRLLVNGKLGDNITCQAFRELLGSHDNNSCSSYHKATKKLQKLQHGLKWVRQARALVSGNLFNLHSISFEAEVLPTDLRNTVVDTTFDVTIFGQRNTLRGLKLHLDSFSRLAAEIAKKAFLWYNKRYRLYGN